MKRNAVTITIKSERGSSVLCVNLAALLRGHSPTNAISLQEGNLLMRPEEAAAIIPQRISLQDLDILIVNQGDNAL